MSASEPRTGGCLCGAVRISARVQPAIGACHCTQCQRWTGGGPLLSVRVHDLEVTGGEATRSYRASGWGERVFCGTCGATLWWKMQDRPVAYVAVGLLDDQTGLEVKSEIFIDHRPGWQPVWADASQRTEAEELAELQRFLSGEAT